MPRAVLSFTNNTVDKEYNQSYFENNQSYYQNNQSYWKTIQSYQSYNPMVIEVPKKLLLSCKTFLQIPYAKEAVLVLQRINFKHAGFKGQDSVLIYQVQAHTANREILAKFEWSSYPE